MCIKLSPNFYKYLEFRGWKHKELAKQLGYSEPLISMILSNKRGLSSPFMERLIRLTKLKFDELFIVSDEQGKDVRPDYQWEKRGDVKLGAKQNWPMIRI